ncbi:MAG: PilZ domain-containing protein [Spirochaetaceae bacterium]|nr:MAG: PilZ domain-containing protein [Spirochaetaceae bacterium]
MAQEIRRVEREFIFSNIREKQIPVELHIGTQRIAARLVESSERIVTFAPTGTNYRQPRERHAAVGFFRFRGQPMTFRSTVVEVEDGIIRLRQPGVLHRDLARGFERIVNPEGLSVSLVVHGSAVTLNYPASEMFDPVEEPQFDLGFDVRRISSLLTSFREQAELIAAENRIVMYRERKPESLPERIIASSGRILVLPPLEESTRLLNVAVRERLLLRRHLEELARDHDPSLVEQYDQLLQRRLRRRLSAEVYCPILYHQYVVGYLYLLKGGDPEAAFHPSDLEFVRMFARVFSYSLQVNGYFSGEQQERAFQEAQLIDISGSGLLFSHAAGALDLGLYSEIGLQIDVDGLILPARGRIMRKYDDSQRVYHGVHFSDMQLEHMELLFDRIYGADYRGDIDSRGLVSADDSGDAFET